MTYLQFAYDRAKYHERMIERWQKMEKTDLSQSMVQSNKSMHNHYLQVLASMDTIKINVNSR